MCGWFGWFGWGGPGVNQATGPWAAGGWGWLSLIIPAIFWIALLVLIAWAITRFLRSRPTVPASEAMTIVQARYARGDITRAQYEEMRREFS